MKGFLLEFAITAYRLKNKLINSSAVTKSTAHLSPYFQKKIIQYNENRVLGFQKNICNAPFTSLYFGIDGNAYACCKNRMYSLGNIKKKTIREIWGSNEIANIRSALKKYDFSLGCEGCKEGICAKKYANLMAAAYDTPFSFKSDFPIRMDFELSANCNLACTMCDGNLSSTYRKHFHNLPPKKNIYDETFLDQIDEFLPHLKKANFLGGEPFLIELYYKIWNRLIDKNPNCSINIQTNGHVLNNKVKSILSKGKFSIGISLESIQKKRFESIRLYGSFEKLMQNFLFFKNYCAENNTYLTLAITPLRETIDELKDFIYFANQHMTYLYFNTITEPHDKAIWTLPAEDIKNILDTFQNTKLPTSNHIEQANAHQFYSYYNQIKEWYNDAKSIEENRINLKNLSNDDLIKKINSIFYEMEDLSFQNSTNRDEINSFLNDYLASIIQDREKLEYYCLINKQNAIYDILRKKPFDTQT